MSAATELQTINLKHYPLVKGQRKMSRDIGERNGFSNSADPLEGRAL